jgi:hypothetical protein
MMLLMVWLLTPLLSPWAWHVEFVAESLRLGSAARYHRVIGAQSWSRQPASSFFSEKSWYQHAIFSLSRGGCTLLAGCC